MNVTLKFQAVPKKTAKNYGMGATFYAAPCICIKLGLGELWPAASIFIIIINEEIIMAFSPKTTRTRYKVKKTARYVVSSNKAKQHVLVDAF